MLLNYYEYKQILITIIDLSLVFFLIYQFYQLIKGTSSVKVFYGFVLLYIFWQLVKALQLKIFSEMLGQLFNFGIIFLAIVFQPEIRRFLIRIGEQSWQRRHWIRIFLNDKSPKTPPPHPVFNILPELKKAFHNMQTTRTGCLIIVENQDNLSPYILSGHIIDARVKSILIENIFFKNSPLHDGAVIIKDNRIRSAGCVIKLSENISISYEYGLRHRAALSITLETDALAFILSEESGLLSIAYRGKLYSPVSLLDLEKFLNSLF